ncbi:DUF1848 domain-containing protein [Mailhella massiliensis]|uniref:DUF1848 domain-containing protein n=1 Tax=Mailhella massiliensis TaxID=1903261 RepID=UPI001EF5CBB4|nr:DUF1848 domain-containing protein [Mailhella massiliensis]
MARAHIPGAETPLVISASRATDIPAFHGAWFMGRLNAGFCRRKNPFNPGQESLISFEKTCAFVFWSKNPAPFLENLDAIRSAGFAFYFQFTLNDYEKEGLEPHLPPMRVRLDTFKRLADRLGPHRVIWRFDPIILGGGLHEAEILDRVDRMGRTLSPFTEKLVFSFVDMYRKTARNLHALHPGFRAPSEEEICRLAQGMASMNRSWPHPLTLAACAENTDLHNFGIRKNACVDAFLLSRLCPDNEALQQALHPKPSPLSLLPQEKAPRDKGQRKACGCFPSKDIGAYDTCPHLCAYCYADRSERLVRKNMARCLFMPETREALL